MAAQPIRFDDGAAYEQMMGVWSRLVGEIFLDWLAPPPGLRWLDVGCGNGAFTEMLATRCAPAELQGIDPSAGQLAFARSRPALHQAHFEQGDALALPHPADRFDAAIMALVLVFLPEPARGVAEMARVVGPGGLVGAYMWDMTGGGFPLDPIIDALRGMGAPPPRPPQVEASRAEMLQRMWKEAGLEQVETRTIEVRRSFADFDEFWRIKLTAPSLGPVVAAMDASDVEELKRRVRQRLPADSDGRIAYDARANAIKGRVPRG
ncbi:MAG: class I SAM-dependent methyltransferase [Reyranellaceae bacterium]